VINLNKDNVKALNQRLAWQIENPARGLIYVKLDVTTLQLLAFTDASFTNNKDLLSQIGYILVLADIINKANIIYWLLTKCKRVTRSVLALELYRIAYRFNIGAVIKLIVNKILNINLLLVMCIDLKLLYNCLIWLGTTQEKRLIINVMCLRQAYK